MNDAIRIVAAIDDGYEQHLGVMLCSLFRNHKEDGRCEVYILDGGISAEGKEKVLDLAAMYNAEVHFFVVSPDDFSDFMVSHHISSATYYRLAIANLLPRSIDKVIYLDADLVVLGDIAELWRTPVDEYALAAVRNPGFRGHARLSIPHHCPYFNAGVLLLNLAAWRQKRVGPGVMTFLRDNPDRARQWDQDGLNACLYDQWLMLHPKWNVQTVLLQHNALCNAEFDPEELADALGNPAIVHFTGSSKPWQYMNRHPLKDLYYDYLRLTPWHGFTPPDATFANRVRKALWIVELKTAIKKAIEKPSP